MGSSSAGLNSKGSLSVDARPVISDAQTHELPTNKGVMITNLASEHAILCVWSGSGQALDFVSGQLDSVCRKKTTDYSGKHVVNCVNSMSKTFAVATLP